MISLDAAELAGVHKKVASSRSPLVLWTIGREGGTLRLTGVGPQFSAVGEVEVKGRTGIEMQVATPTAVAAGWLNGITGKIELLHDPGTKTLHLATTRSTVELGTVTEGEDFLALLNLHTYTGESTTLSFGSKLWDAMADVAWASAAGFASNVDPRREAVHISHGAVWTVSDGRVAMVDLDVPDGVYPMIPADLTAVAKLIEPDLTMVSVDQGNRLHVFDGDTEFIAPLIGGEPLPLPIDHPNLVPTRTGPVCCFEAAAFLDALKRLDRIDNDEGAKYLSVNGRVQVKSIDEGALGLSVNIGERMATEAIDCWGPASMDVVFDLRSIRNFVAFTGQDEVSIHRHPDHDFGPFYVEHADRRSWLMGAKGKGFRRT